jgi:hypothetical protein
VGRPSMHRISPVGVASGFSEAASMLTC